MRKIFRPGEVRPAGYVFPIPAKARHLADNKPSRPFFLLTRCSEPELGTLALMTTKSTEGVYGARLHEFRGQAGRQRLPGQERSYADLASLIFRGADRLEQSDHVLARYVGDVRAGLKAALGFGQGTGPGTAGTSIRGHLVRLSRRIAELYEFEYGVVLTEHAYSAARRLQVLVPVIDVRSFLVGGETVADFVPEPGDVIPPPGRGWLRQLPISWPLPVIDTVRLASFSERWEESARRETWLQGQIEHVFPVPVDPVTLERIEAALMARLELPAT